MNYREVALAVETLPKRMYVERTLLGMSLRTAAEQIGIANSTLCQLEKGVFLPRADTIKLCFLWLAEKSGETE